MIQHTHLTALEQIENRRLSFNSVLASPGDLGDNQRTVGNK